MKEQKQKEQYPKEQYQIGAIAHIVTDFSSKFGIPRQSGLVEELEGRILFEPEYGTKEAVKGLEEFSHIWLIWGFSENRRESYSLTVRPPKLGGNTRKGVFSTRSPFRPNGLGLSCVRLEKIEFDEKERPVLYVKGADLMNGTPIFDIKPYIPYSDCHMEAEGSFASVHQNDKIKVYIPEELEKLVPEEKRSALLCCIRTGPKTSLSKRPGADLWILICGNGNPFPGKRRVSDCL